MSESARTTDHAGVMETSQRKVGEIAVGRSTGINRRGTLLQLLIEDYRRHDRPDLGEAKRRVNRLLKPTFGELRAEAFSARALNNYIQALQKRGYGEMLLSRGQVESPKCVWLFSTHGEVSERAKEIVRSQLWR